MLKLLSGVGYDVVVLLGVIDVVMLFVCCMGGILYNFVELVIDEDVVVVIEVVCEFVCVVVEKVCMIL